MKSQNFPIILKRDGPNCFYCSGVFVGKIKAKLTKQEDLIREWDHLNDDETDNRVENLCFAHRKCNRAKQNDFDMKMRALEKLNENERLAEIPEVHSNTDKDTTAELDTNGVFIKIARDYLDELLNSHNGHPPIDDKLPLKTTCDILAAKGIKKTGHGSPITFRRIVDVLCSGEFEFEKFKEDGVFWIRLRYDEMMD